MKSRISALLALFILLASLSPAYAEKTVGSADYLYVLPKSLLLIENEAFSDTPVQTLILPYGFSRIEDGAFNGANGLRDVFMPPTALHIAETAIPLQNKITVHGVKGSYAQGWARRHNVPFVEDDIWRHPLNHGGGTEFPDADGGAERRAVNPERHIRPVARPPEKAQSRRPQDRQELNPIDYRFP